MSTRRRARAAGLAGALLIGLTAAPGAATARPGPLRVGVGRADITPVTGAFKGGWACTCARATGQHERLYARVVVIRQGAQKVALVAEDLFALSAGMIRDAAALLPGLGFSEQNVIDSATHTHSSQAGYMNHPGDNLILPSTGNLTLSGLANLAADPVMYSFMTRQLAVAIRRADADLRPGAVGWGQTELLGVTMNRSLGAHLADFGITTAGANGGSVSQDPGGYPDTIDPAVNVLRVDQYRGRQRVPVGMFSTFANHGTIDHANFSYYSGDHQGAAERVVEAAIRGAGRVPASQDVVNAFANSDAGDMTSGIQYVGPAAAEYIGRREAAAMLAAWRGAGRAMTNHPALALRWTRVCFCGQQTSGGVIDSTPWVGKAAGAGSEEGRTIFYYLGLANEGDRLPIDLGPQGDKIPILNAKGTISQAVPLTSCGSAAADRHRPGGADRRRGQADRRRAAVADRARGHRPSDARRLRRRLPQLLHDAGRVRATGLRGRIHDVRPLLVAGAPRRAGGARAAAARRSGRAGSLPVSTPTPAST